MSALTNEAAAASPQSIGRSPESGLRLAPLSLRRNFSWTLAGNFVFAACQWGTLVTFAKLGTPEMVGRFAFGLAVTAPLFMFANLQLRTIQITDARNDYEFRDVLGLRLVCMLLALIVAVGLAAFLSGGWEVAMVIFILALSKASDGLTDTYHGFLHKYERLVGVSKVCIVNGLCSVSCVAVLVYATGSVAAGAAGWLLGSLLTLVLSVAMASVNVKRGALAMPDDRTEQPADTRFIPTMLLPRFRASVMKQLAWLAAPLGLVMMLVSLDTNIPRYFIQESLGERQLGLFAALAYVMVGARMLVMSVGQSISPRLARYYVANNQRDYARILLKLIAFGVAGGAVTLLGAALLGKPILTLIYTAEYAELNDVFVLLTAATALGSIKTLVERGVTPARKYKTQLVFNIIITTLMAGLSAIWIPAYGLSGAGLAVVATSAVALLLYSGLALHIYRSMTPPPSQRAPEL